MVIQVTTVYLYAGVSTAGTVLTWRCFFLRIVQADGNSVPMLFFLILGLNIHEVRTPEVLRYCRRQTSYLVQHLCTFYGEGDGFSFLRERRPVASEAEPVAVFGGLADVFA